LIAIYNHKNKYKNGYIGKKDKYFTDIFSLLLYMFNRVSGLIFLFLVQKVKSLDNHIIGK